MENNELNLHNLGVLVSKLPDSLLNKLKIECSNFFKKKNIISDLTSNGVVKHYDLEDNNIELFNFLNEWVIKYNEKYNYFRLFKGLYKDTSLIFQKPWFNIQKKGEFIPSHNHAGVLSYSIWIQLPSLNKEDNNNFASCFEFQYQNILGASFKKIIHLDKNSEGNFVLFPSLLPHCVYPFFGSEEIRISVSGNICFNN
jgi:hypothetical protein